MTIKRYVTILAIFFSGVIIGVAICLVTYIHQVDFWGIVARQEAVEAEIDYLVERGQLMEDTARNMINYMSAFDSAFGVPKEEGK